MAGLADWLQGLTSKVWRGRDLAIDMGTRNLLIFEHGKGVVVSEPSVVAVNSDSREVLAAGSEAEAMLDRTGSDVVAARPMQDGVINNIELATLMLGHFVSQGQGRAASLTAPGVFAIIGIPVGIDDVHERAYHDVARQAGIGEMQLVYEPLAAAVGAGIRIGLPKGNLVVDIGGGTTDIAVISNGALITTKSVRVAGDSMDRAIRDYVRRNMDLDISLAQAEQVKIEMGSAVPEFDQDPKEVAGQHLQKRRPDKVMISAEDVRQALKAPVEEIISHLLRTLEMTPAALAEDVMREGILLAGGGALLHGLDQRINEATALPVKICPDPKMAVIKGLESILTERVSARG